jgi:hypothetical protein
MTASMRESAVGAFMAKARGKNFGPPMTLANMRLNGVRAVTANARLAATPLTSTSAEGAEGKASTRFG